MCGRYKLSEAYAEIARLFELSNSVNLRPRYNIAPTQDVLAVTYDAEAPATNDELKALLRSFPTEQVTCWKIGARVGNVRNDDPACVERLTA